MSFRGHYRSYGLDTKRGGHWTDRALCRQLIAAGQADPDLWFPLMTGSDRPQVRRAKRICRQCPVWRECLADALDRGEEEGIWGGLTDRERRRLQQQKTGAA